jgi:hypothetical protein
MYFLSRNPRPLRHHHQTLLCVPPLHQHPKRTHPAPAYAVHLIDPRSFIIHSHAIIFDISPGTIFRKAPSRRSTSTSATGEMASVTWIRSRRWRRPHHASPSITARWPLYLVVKTSWDVAASFSFRLARIFNSCSTHSAIAHNKKEAIVSQATPKSTVCMIETLIGEYNLP